MSRVLFTCRPLTGHFEPLRPLAGALTAAGHEVAFASGEPVARRAHEAGFEAFAGLELGPRAEDLAAVIARWGPHLIVHEVAELAGPLAATAAGLPYATAAYGILPPRAVLRAAGDAAAPFWERAGLAPPPCAGLLAHLYLDVCPPGLQLPWATELGAVQPVRPATGSDPAPPWLAQMPHRRTVYVTFGTVWNQDPARFAAVIDALVDEPLNLVVTTGGTDVRSPAPNVRVEPFVPQAAILPWCDAVICHGGSRTMLGALAHGRPLVVLAQGADQFDNGRRVAAVDAGITLDGTNSIRDATLALLDDERYARTVAALAAEIAAMPTAADAVPVLERLARG